MLDTTALVFGMNPVPETRETWKTLVPFDRFVCAWSGDTLIGTGVSLDSSLSVPGGAVLDMAAVSAVAVLPTHRVAVPLLRSWARSSTKPLIGEKPCRLCGPARL